MQVQVTQEDIEMGEPGNSRCCPIALALQRLTGCAEVQVEESTCSLGRGTERVTLNLPREARAFVSDYDEDWTVKPIEFELPIPPAYAPKA